MPYSKLLIFKAILRLWPDRGRSFIGPLERRAIIQEKTL